MYFIFYALNYLTLNWIYNAVYLFLSKNGSMKNYLGKSNMSFIFFNVPFYLSNDTLSIWKNNVFGASYIHVLFSTPTTSPF